MKDIKIRLADIIYFFAFFYLVVDTINGITIRNFDFSVSQIYKSIYLLLVLCWFIYMRIYKPIYILLVFLCLIFIHLFYIDNVSYVIEDVLMASRFMTIVFSYYFFRTQLLINPNYFVKVKRLFYFLFFVLLVNLFFGYLGFGYAQYTPLGLNMGTRGWFKPGNEVNLVFIVISLFLLSYVQIRRKRVLTIYLSLFIIFIGITLFSRAAIIGSIIIVLGTQIINLFSNRRLKTVNQFIVLGIVLILSGSLIINYFLYKKMAINYYGDITETSVLISALIDDKGRAKQKDNVMEEFYSNPKSSKFLFGASSEIIVQAGTVEIDHVHIFAVFGISGIILIYGFYMNMIIISIKNKLVNNSRFAVYNVLGIILILSIGAIAGHVMTSGLAGIIMGTYFALPYSKNRFL